MWPYLCLAMALEAGLDAAWLDDAEMYWSGIRGYENILTGEADNLLFQSGCISLATDSEKPSKANLPAW